MNVNYDEYTRLISLQIYNVKSYGREYFEYVFMLECVDMKIYSIKLSVNIIFSLF